MEFYTRSVKRPDNVDQIISMEGWFWNALDWMNAEMDWKESKFIALAWKTVRKMEHDGTMKNPGNLQAEFADAFRMYVGYRATCFIHEEQDIPNDP